MNEVQVEPLLEAIHFVALSRLFEKNGKLTTLKIILSDPIKSHNYMLSQYIIPSPLKSSHNCNVSQNFMKNFKHTGKLKGLDSVHTCVQNKISAVNILLYLPFHMLICLSLPLLISLCCF